VIIAHLVFTVPPRFFGGNMHLRRAYIGERSAQQFMRFIARSAKQWLRVTSALVVNASFTHGHNAPSLHGTTLFVYCIKDLRTARQAFVVWDISQWLSIAVYLSTEAEQNNLNLLQDVSTDVGQQKIWDWKVKVRFTKNPMRKT